MEKGKEELQKELDLTEMIKKLRYLSNVAWGLTSKD